MYLEPIRKHKAPADDPSIGIRLGTLAVIVIVLFAVLGFRLWFLQILSGDQYIVMAEDNRLRTVKIEAPRGVIYDRNMDPLVENRAGLSVGVLPMDLRNEEEVLPRLADVLDMPLSAIEDKVEQGSEDPYVLTILKEDVDEETVVAYLQEHRLEFPGVRIEKSYLRSYPRDEFATHVLGYAGEVSEEELETEKFRSLKQGARVGKDGVEFTYDNFLRGTDGSRTVEVDAAGRPKRELSVNQPSPGKNLVLTIDSRIQDAAERAIREEGIERAKSQGFENADAGVVIAMDPRNGEVLAMVSYPDYPQSWWVGGMSRDRFEVLNSEEAGNPLFNRSISGLYPAASTFKPFVALTALNENMIEPSTTFFDPGDYWYGEQRWKCWEDDGHGEVNLVEGLMVSCDTYFYNLGERFYHQEGPVLQDGLRQFGFEDYTGIDLPDEYYGRVPDAEWKRKRGETSEERAWKPGDDINLSIGQGDLLVTPLQLATAFAAIANSSTPREGDRVALNLLVPRLALRVTDAAGNSQHKIETEKKGEVLVQAEDLRAVRKGLEYVTSDSSGTAYAAFEGFPETVVGKTGTAEKKPEEDYAWFMGYAPAEEPEILVVALVEEGGHGSSVAAPVVRRVLEAHFGLEQELPEEIEVTE